jgi:hypothetical protein
VGSAGDVNGDGYSDVVVGAYEHDAGGGADANRGRAYLYMGSAAARALPAWTASGDADHVQFGKSVAGAGDVNGRLFGRRQGQQARRRVEQVQSRPRLSISARPPV